MSFLLWKELQKEHVVDIGEQPPKLSHIEHILSTLSLHLPAERHRGTTRTARCSFSFYFSVCFSQSAPIRTRSAGNTHVLSQRASRLVARAAVSRRYCCVRCASARGHYTSHSSSRACTVRELLTKILKTDEAFPDERIR